ncbi:hypothetical protein ACQPZF_25175 [Actinosynnema sp. CS-041913]|uniref:hypothetical protein n=1 Tax=Actinosynnema sp. CS-041913 TaxID=3239917 RepID=UPI003D924471
MAETEIEMDDREGRRSDREFSDDVTEDVKVTAKELFKLSDEDWKKLQEVLDPIAQEVSVRVDDITAIDRMDSAGRSLDNVVEKITDGIKKDLQELIDEMKKQREEEIGLQKRKGRLYCRAKGLLAVLAIITTVNGIGPTVIAVLKYIKENQGLELGDEVAAGVRGTSTLTPDQKKKVQKQLDRWWALDDSLMWAHLAGRADRWDPSLQGQVLMVEIVKLAAKKPAQAFVWNSSADKAKAVQACVDAYWKFTPKPGKPKSRALYEFVVSYRYNGNRLSRPVAADVVELALYQIIESRRVPIGARLHFPGKGDSANLLYAITYFGRVRRKGRAIRGLHPRRRRTDDPHEFAQLRLHCGELPVFQESVVNQWLDKFDKTKREQLIARRDKAIAAWRKGYPLRPNEKVTSEFMTALQTHWGGNEQYTLVYSRSTDQGALAVVVQGSKIDRNTGDYECLAEGFGLASEIDGRAEAKDSPVPLDIVEQCLGTLSMIAFACGPYGAVIGAVGLALNTILTVSFPPKQVNLPKILDDILKADLAVDHIRDDMTKILAYTKWVSQQAEAAVANEYNYKQGKAYNDTLNEIKSTVTNALEPNYPLLTAISRLQNGDFDTGGLAPFKILALPAFIQGMTIHLLYLQVSILLSNDATTFKSPKTVYLVNAAKDYQKHLKTQIGAISDKYYSRMRYSGSPIEQTPTSHDCSGGYCTYSSYLMFEDPMSDSFPRRPATFLPPRNEWRAVWYEKCDPKKGGGWDCPSSDAQKAHKDYWASVETDLRNFYNFSATRQDDLNKAVGRLQEIIDKYEPLTRG